MAQLEVLQQGDFEGIFKAMDGLPVVVRLIDPPLHEFLPNLEEQLVKVTKAGDAASDEDRELLATIQSMHEQNPMLGLRGVRLGIIRPAINAMQVRAIFSAACQWKKEGLAVHPEIMIPVTSHFNEVKTIRDLINRIAHEVMEEMGVEVEYKVGTMIEVPRAAITADQMAEYSEFFSFGTNDLTQTTYGISRDDAEGKFLLDYVERGLLPANPFQVLDPDGVGYLIEMATRKGRETRPALEVGICGEHGGDPESIAFCHKTRLNYVSCSPFRVPIARLAAAQAALFEEGFTAKEARLKVN
jgi:pyruvate,orthophosphate dikinase